MENGNKNFLDNILGIFKTHADLIKGVVGVLLGGYLISLKLYVVIDFVIFASGTALLLYGLVALKVTRVQELLSGFMGFFKTSRPRP